jgi:phosphoglycolate phosphatase
MGCMNRVLGKRDMPLLTKERYRKIFGFPVKEYYRRAGFDFKTETFETVSAEFIAHYYRDLSEPKLHQGARELVEELDSSGIMQGILSAMEIEPLHQQLRMNGIEDRMKYIRGLNHTYATGKVEIGKSLLEQVGNKGGKTIYIGDTRHDVEVAQALDLEVIILAHGHHEPEMFETANCMVFTGFHDLRNYLLGNRGLDAAR